MSGIEFFVGDVESLGLNPAYHEMTEISLIRVSNKCQLWRCIKCDYPERANIDALRMTHKTIEDLSNGDTREQIVELCNKFLNEDGLTPSHRCLIGHNVSFDRRMCWALWEKVGKELPISLYVDTMVLTRAYAKKIGLVKPKVNLDASCNMLGIKKFAGAHSAQSDTRNTYLLWKALTETHNMDPLPFIKTLPHQISPPDPEEDCGLDPSLLDL